MIGDLLATLASYPTLSRTATSALADIAEAMKATATMEEIECLLGGAMTEEVYIRFACLQALQVRLISHSRCAGLMLMISPAAGSHRV
jgi:hypothetical protein